MIAAYSDPDSEQKTRLLLDAGADPAARTAKGETDGADQFISATGTAWAAITLAVP
jgi:hypothetical protein